MTDTLIGKHITLRPTEGGYQTEQAAMIVWETPSRITVRINGRNGARTFIKATGEPYAKADKEFPCYVALMDTIV